MSTYWLQVADQFEAVIDKIEKLAIEALRVEYEDNDPEIDGLRAALREIVAICGEQEG